MQIIDYLDDKLFEADEGQFFYLNKWVYYDRIDISKGSDPAKSKKNKDLPLFVK